MSIRLELDLDELEGLAARFDVAGRAMERAALVAANRAVRWARVQLQRGLAARLGVPQNALQGRLKALVARRRGSAAVWIALAPLNVVRARPKVTRTGVAAAGRDFEGAFVGRGRYGGRAGLRRKGAARTPLEAVSLDVAGVGVPLIRLQAWPELEAQFLRLYVAELERRGAAR